MSILRIGFIGSCQVAGMKATAEKLLPSALIDAQHIHVTMRPEDVREHVRHFDVVITQVGDGDADMPYLRASSLTSPTLKAVYLPTFVFSGLHPDMAYIADHGKVVHGAHSDMHSIIGAACFLAQLSEARAAKLFNKYIFAELGYFAEYEVSYRFMRETYAAAGYDVDGLVERLLAESGAFMHTINHPSIQIIAELTTQALKKAGIVAPDVAVPTDVHDALKEHFVGPVFPPLARSIGLAGSTTYLKPAQSGDDREIGLEEYLKRSYEIYRSVDRETIAQGRIREAFGTIGALVAPPRS
ncbi:hypothetical protein SAMN02799631_04706 [Methylobacterium sp. 174MFSha1.1]|uniref:WcbI family polysaccharide biosynthesis putative acetyltransferase n=1 Tax=Methylobacterium sp. 174MFSha1.1 TaxID=1502749 RepID=UPI0008E29504|nr:WcbI family polysaccharide biosynthesis putative acetyltransferase [Methylobacterium sp. 174MFSha1.1]SFV08284.1 hypothetical protein SAMN02799631_04706 [Methylobacterium sp. 174MFSha1.1]